MTMKMPGAPIAPIPRVHEAESRRTDIASSGSTESQLDAEVYAQNVRDLYAQSRFVLSSSVVIASLLVTLHWGVTPSPALLTWWLAIVWMTAVRLWVAHRYRKLQPRPAEAPRWGIFFVVGSATSGVVWGSAGWLFFTDDPQGQLVISFVLAGMAAGATTTLPSLLPAFWSFLFPALLPLIAKLVVAGDPRLLVMGAMMSAFVIYLALIGRTTHRSLSESHRVRFKNERLAEQLQAAEAGLRDANEHLESRVAERTVELERIQRAQAETERELRHSQRMEALGQLTRGFAHDFNNILTIVVGSVELIRIDREADPQLQELTEHALAATGRAARLTRSLLAFSRTQQLRPERLIVNDVVRRIVDELLERALGQRIRIETRLVQDLWPVRVDPVQLETALLNLAINSRDAMPNGGTLTFETRNVAAIAARGGTTQSEDQQDSVCISVADTGVGIPDELAHRVFEPFFTTKETGQGSGLGLSMVYGFVQQSGGRIQLLSRESQGCVFSLYFPVEAALREQTSVDESAPLHRNIRGNGEVILIVEDEERVRDLTQRMLRSLGYDTILASDAESALQMLRREPSIDLMLTDVTMPGTMDGGKLAQLALRLRPALKIVLMSGYTDTALNESPAASWRILHKPYTTENLGRAIRAAFGEPPSETLELKI